MKQKLSILIIALSTFLYAEAYDFQSGNLCYNITSNSEPYTVEVTYQNYWSTDNYSGKTTITIPETVTYGGHTYSVTSIGSNAFSNCSGLTSVTIPNSVTSIGDYAFLDCSGLKSVKVSWEEPLLINYGVFNGLTLSNISLYVPNSVKAKYEAAEVWKEFNIVGCEEPTAIKAVEAENNKTIKTIKDGQIVIIRNGVMYDMNGRKK